MSKLQQASSSYLDLARTYFASSADYTNIFNSVTGALESLGVSSKSEGEQQIELATQNLSELKKLESIVSGAYVTAKTDFGVQKGLLQEQIDHLLSITGGIEAVRDILAGLSPELAGQFNTGGTGVKPGGMPPSSYDVLAQQWVSLMQPYGLTKSPAQVARELPGLSAAELQNNYNIGAGHLGNGAKRTEWDALFTRLREGMIDGSHRGGLDYVPFDGYIAQLHKGESVQTASENRSYGVRSSDTVSSLVAEVKLLREEINLLRKENREDTGAVVAVTAKANELNAKVIVEGVNEARNKEAYSNNLGVKLR
jgi:hypothetical protein